jgi:uncharacterized protein YndB with AHSA1/START domain
MTSGPPAPKIEKAAELTVSGEFATLVFRRRLRHPPERVWQAITDPEQMRSWFLTEAKVEGRPGGTVDLVTGPDRVHATGRVLEWDPPRLWEHEWNVLPGPFLPKGEAAIVRWELTPVSDGTLLEVTHRRLTRATAETFARGIRGFMDRLAAQLDGTPLPEWNPSPATPKSN